MGKQSGTSQELQDAQTKLAGVMADTGKQTAAQGKTLFDLALPGLTKAQSYYGKLATGDPSALARANSPAIEQISNQSNLAKQNILENMPRGGERNLALEEADLSKYGKIGDLTTGSYVNSFPSLAQLGGQNVSQGTAATGTGLQGMNSAANQYGNLQQLNNEQKGTQLGFLSSLAGAGATAATAFCWVAAELYGGWFEPRTMAIRSYFYRTLRTHGLGWIFYRLYLEFGESWAAFIKTHRVWRSITKIIFDGLLVKAQRES